MVYRLGRASLETLRNMSDEEIDRLVKGVSGKGMILDGSSCSKAFNTGLRTARVDPKAVLSLVINIARS